MRETIRQRLGKYRLKSLLIKQIKSLPIGKEKSIKMLRLRTDLIRHVHSPLPDYCGLPLHYILDVTTGDQLCDHCDNRKLRTQRMVNRYPVGILLGHPVLKHYIKKCPVCKREYPFEKINALVPAHSNYAYDIITWISIQTNSLGI